MELWEHIKPEKFSRNEANPVCGGEEEDCQSSGTERVRSGRGEERVRVNLLGWWECHHRDRQRNIMGPEQREKRKEDVRDGSRKSLPWQPVPPQTCTCINMYFRYSFVYIWDNSQSDVYPDMTGQSRVSRVRLSGCPGSEDQRPVTEASLGELPTQGIYSVEVRTLHSTQPFKGMNTLRTFNCQWCCWTIFCVFCYFDEFFIHIM